MKNFKNILMLLAVVALLGITSCGGDDDDVSERQKVLNAITGSHSIDVASSTIPADAAISTAGIFVSTDDATGGVTITTTGDLTSWIAGGSFTVGEDGSVSGTSVTAAEGSNLSISSSSAAVDLTANTMEIVINTAAAGRVAGIGAWTLSIAL